MRLSQVNIILSHAVCSKTDLRVCETLPSCDDIWIDAKIVTSLSHEYPCKQWSDVQERGFRPGRIEKPGKNDPLPGSRPGETPGDRMQDIVENNSPTFSNKDLEDQRLKGVELIDLSVLGTPKSYGYNEVPAVAGPKSWPVEGSKNSYLDDFKISGQGQTWVRNEVKDPTTGDSILDTCAAPEQRALVIKQSYNIENDQSKKLRWSSMTMSNWREACKSKGTRTEDLNKIVRDNILEGKGTDSTTSKGVQLNTYYAIEEAFEVMRADVKKTLTLNPINPRTANELKVVELMTAQTHISRVYFMLKDYRTELGNKNIKLIHLMSEDHEKTGGRVHIVLELGPA
ncbi:hypothetical protein EJ05DRAFT_526242 [Pseudovirgaria hyperparasitica]|uniref:Uncharacterized protein n=1 Tax=Pseudovirgaria hyperparasitica TaxID=470096 RepID=A0A6A6WAI2_9PEZI|nr:uncharacterized protein EJ05DRAFT_526242 [Pseudovirgaria hyperparasitica]KAF2759575.1 hypothetical protein EJ05DRAFT_526242 [Pseudovirgaria hyperparasitica]